MIAGKELSLNVGKASNLVLSVKVLSKFILKPHKASKSSLHH